MNINDLKNTFFEITLIGDSTRIFLDKTFHVDSIKLCSSEFDTDLDATSDMFKAINVVVNKTATNVNWQDVEEKLEFNPIFFPSFAKEKTREQLAEEETEAVVEDEMSEALAEEGKIALYLKTDFDTEGDNTISRVVIKLPQSQIIGKVKIGLDDYLSRRAQDKIEFKESFLCFKPPIDSNNIYN